MGSKAELNERIRYFLKTGKKLASKRKYSWGKRLKNNSKQELGLQTKIIPNGVRFNSVLRKFLADYFKRTEFKFTKEMAMALREAEKKNNTAFSIADLIVVYKKGRDKKSLENNPEDKTGEWNRFVRDFNKDKRTKKLGHKMKIAASLWKKVRESDKPKVYTTGLLNKFKILK